jgi:hypothetical protein
MQSQYNCYIEAISIIAETVAVEIEIKLGGGSRRDLYRVRRIVMLMVRMEEHRRVPEAPVLRSLTVAADRQIGIPPPRRSMGGACACSISWRRL